MKKCVKSEMGAKNEKGARRSVPNQWFASNHQVNPYGPILILGSRMDLFIMEG